MSKRKTKHRRRSFPEAQAAATPKPQVRRQVEPKRQVGGSIDEHPQPKHRDGIEQLIIAIILAVLFRSFEAEAFIIPTGSMAPTLQGKHKDVKCPECKYRYRTGVAEFEPNELYCPYCAYSYNTFTPSEAPTFSGDRILVNKFAYQFGEPKRWDVIVFKNPSNSKQNYIKRLVGLPNERIRIRHGDVFSAPLESDDFRILRKPAHKVLAMLQPVHDTKFIPPSVANSEWPSRWFDAQASEANGWQISEDRSTYLLPATDSPQWLNYRHVIPSESQWRDIKRGRLKQPVVSPALITDQYAYNASKGTYIPSGWHWVGDLAIEADLEVNSQSGTVFFKLIEAGHHLVAAFDVASGEVSLSIDDGAISFDGADKPVISGKTPVKGSGRYRITLANVDQRLLLWVNNKRIPLGTTPDVQGLAFSMDTSMPKYSDADPGDLNPARIGGQGVDLEVRRLRILRDIYYIACKSQGSHPMNQMNIDYRLSRSALRRELADESGTARQDNRWPQGLRAEVAELMRSPDRWDKTEWFESRATVEFEMLEDQFFPMGDNAPRSQDARLWAGPKRRVELQGRMKPFPADYPSDRFAVGHFVPRSQLIGKAFLIYWPHGWPLVSSQLNVIPNVQRMGRIK